MKLLYMLIFTIVLTNTFSEKVYTKAELSILSGSVLIKKKEIDGVLRYSRNVSVHLDDDIQTSRDFRGFLILENGSRLSLEWGKLYRWRKQGFFLIEKNRWLRLGELRESSYQNKRSVSSGTIGEVFVRGKVDITRPKEFQHRRLSGKFSLVKGDIIEVLGSSQVGIEMVDGAKIELGKGTIIEVSEYGLYLRIGFVSVLGDKAQNFEVLTSDLSIMGRTDDYQFEVVKQDRTQVRNLRGVSKVVEKSSSKIKFLKPRMQIVSNPRKKDGDLKEIGHEEDTLLSPENIKDYARKDPVVEDLTPTQLEHKRIYDDIQLQLKGEFKDKPIKVRNRDVAGKKYLKEIKEMSDENWKNRKWSLDKRQKVTPVDPNDFVKEAGIDANDFETRRDQKYFRERNLSSSIRSRLKNEIGQRRAQGQSVTNGSGEVRSSARIIELRDSLNQKKLNQSKILNEKNRLDRQKNDIDRKVALATTAEERAALNILKREVVVRLNRITSDSRNIALIISQLSKELIREKQTFNTRVSSESEFENRARRLVQ